MSAFCRRCGGPLALAVPEGEDRDRLCCAACGFIEYQNPRVEVACVVADAAGGICLHHAALAPGERIQGAALRSLEGDCGTGVLEEQLALFCALTDTEAGRVVVVFHAPAARDGVAGRDRLPGPGWVAPLLEAFGADARAGRRAVYTAAWDGRSLRMAEVRRD